MTPVKGYRISVMRSPNIKDAEALCTVAISAFEEDRQYQPESAKIHAPPGYDDINAHLKWMSEHLYFKYVVSKTIAAGCIVRVEHVRADILGLFVRADMMNLNIGRNIVEYLFTNYPEIRSWELETPDYAIRNHAFYEKLGFQCVRKTKQDPDLGFGFYKYKATM